MAHDREAVALLAGVLGTLWEIATAPLPGQVLDAQQLSLQLAPHLLAVLRDNLDLVAYLCDVSPLPSDNPPGREDDDAEPVTAP